jgi:hypothetical protein
MDYSALFISSTKFRKNTKGPVIFDLNLLRFALFLVSLSYRIWRFNDE